jgi:hypothetical protein
MLLAETKRKQHPLKYLRLILFLFHMLLLAAVAIALYIKLA